MRNTKKMKRNRKRTIGGVTQSKILTNARRPFLSYIETPKPTQGTPSRIKDLMLFSKARSKYYVPKEISRFLGETEENLTEEFLTFVKQYEGSLTIRDYNKRPFRNRDSLNPRNVGRFIKGELKRKRSLYNAFFTFTYYKFVFSGIEPIPKEITGFLRRFGVDT